VGNNPQADLNRIRTENWSSGRVIVGCRIVSHIFLVLDGFFKINPTITESVKTELLKRIGLSLIIATAG
jgi:hypothetical protein